jgi:hypothetical protein
MFDAVLTRLYKKLPEVRGRLYTPTLAQDRHRPV